MRRLALLLGAFSLAFTAAAATPPPARTISDAITEIDLERARHLLEVTTGDATALALERARLSIYAGDCDAAQAQLSAPTLTTCSGRWEARSTSGRTLTRPSGS